MRVALPTGKGNLLAADFSNQYASFQIPIDTVFARSSPSVTAAGTDDVQRDYGTGFPTRFENGEGRLPAHWIVNASFGRAAERAGKRLGYTLSVDNLLDHRYLIKVNNGFNTTQWNAPRRVVLRLTAPW